MQAPEISSNSIKDSLAVNEKKDLLKNLDRNDMKDKDLLKEAGGWRVILKVMVSFRMKSSVEIEQGEILSAPSAQRWLGLHWSGGLGIQRWKEYAKQGKMPCYFDLIEENVYLTER